MENKLYSKDCITLDGRMDEAVWETAKEYTGFRFLKTSGGELAPEQTSFKILPCEDRVYFGIRCEQKDMARAVEVQATRALWGSDSVELYIAPSGSSFEFYQFVVTLSGQKAAIFRSEGGTIQPDPYAPDWNTAVYVDENCWSIEIELPLTAFYMTNHDTWNHQWRLNVCRNCTSNCRPGQVGEHSSWTALEMSFMEPQSFGLVDGFPMRPASDDIYMSYASVEITSQDAEGFCGNLAVKATSLEAADFEFVSDNSQPAKVQLNAVINEFTVPCKFAECGRYQLMLQLTRLSDGKVFKRYYPVRVIFEPIVVKFSQPEFRTDFFPGQDYSRVVGKVYSSKPVTLALDGPGIEKQVITPAADGSFMFETSGFAIGEAKFTAAIEGYELTRKIRRLPKSDHQMSWISGGALVVDGKPVMRRTMYAEYFAGGEAFKLKYDADDLHQTKFIRGQAGWIEPGRLIKSCEAPGGEATRDGRPSEEMFRKLDETLAMNKDRDFTYYYITDEPECRKISSVYLKHIYDYITEKDPYHVIVMSSRSCEEYVECADWFETHPYLNPSNHPEKGRIFSRTINSMGNYIDAISKLNRSDKCIGFLPTCFSYSGRYADYPTFAEYLCHSWAAIIHGAKSLRPYAYLGLNDRAGLYEGTRYLFTSAEALEKLILTGKRSDLLLNQNVHGVLYDCGDEKMFVLVNTTMVPQKVALEGIDGQWHNFRHGGMITGNSFDLKPLEVVIGTSEVRDAGLPTYQQVEALVNEQEYARTHGGSLLYDREPDLDITCTASANNFSNKKRLFDGVKDNYGWEMLCDGDKFLEISLTKVQPRFNKLVVHGFHVDDMEVKVRNKGELSVPAVSEVKTEEFSITYQFAEAICPEALRLEFHSRKVELYEIELF